MVRQKRFDILLEAFAQSADKSSTLTIVGDGPLRNSLKRLAGSLGIADRVDMPGFADDLIPWLRKSDLFVLSSDYEGLPAVVIEALACGVPVVATNSFESAGELLGGLESCAVTPISDPQRLAEAIDRSLSERADVAALRGIARGYLIEDAIAAHIVHLGRLVARRQAELSKR
jgi:glycosyltransferase involved in cell wall biosynthesis